MDISKFFMKGDIKGAIEYMKQREEYKDVLPLYIDIFEKCNYRKYEIEYRAKLVELCYCNDEKLLPKFIQEADETRENDSHGLASAKIKKEFSDTDKLNISFIQNRALQLFKISSAEMNEKYSHS